MKVNGSVNCLVRDILQQIEYDDNFNIWVNYPFHFNVWVNHPFIFKIMGADKP